MCALVTGVQTCALPIWAFGSTGSPLYRAVVAINQGVAGIVAQASGSAAATDRTFDAFLPKAGIQMAWTPNLKTGFTVQRGYRRSEEHTSELQSLMRISYAVFCLKKKTHSKKRKQEQRRKPRNRRRRRTGLSNE